MMDSARPADRDERGGDIPDRRASADGQPTRGEASDGAAREAPPPRGRDKPDSGRDDAERKKSSNSRDGENAGDENKNDGKDETKRPMPRWKKLLYWAIGLAVLAALAVAGTLYWLHARHFESTDDAFIDAYMSQVAPQVAGRVINLAITDNQQVQAGQLLVELDGRDYQVKLDQVRAQRASAVAQRDQARAQLVVQQATIEQQQAQVRVAEADLGQAQTDLARYRSIDPRAIARQQLDTSSATFKSAQARVDAARQALAGSRAQLGVTNAQIEAAEASIQQSDADIRNAELQLSYTRVTAPQAGRVTRRTVQLGNYVNTGQALLAVVPDAMWVTANFKETQLTDMRPGQPVEVSVDAFSGRKLRGRVDSIQRGTGAVFSSLPAENATGNYVKVVQRVPVKIVFEGDDWRDLPLAPGLSVVPRVTVR